MNRGKERPVISVFGSHAPAPASEDYEQARKLGRLLAESGLAVATGGYEGVMAAVSRGAAEAGGWVIGVTSPQIERYRGAVLNRWVDEEVRYPTARQRLIHLVENNQGMVVLPGGVGTLSEFSLAWSLLQVGALAPTPLVLLGLMWRQTIKVFEQPGYGVNDNLGLLYFADTPDMAVEYIVGWPQS